MDVNDVESPRQPPNRRPDPGDRRPHTGVPLSPDRFLVLPSDVTLTNCDREAIHIPGGIQPHGALLGVDPRSTEIVVESSNATVLLGLSSPALGQRIGDLELGAIDHLGEHIAATGANRLYRRFTARDGRCFDTIVHHVDDLAIVEFEPVAADAAVERLLLDAVALTSELADAEDLADARQRAVRTVRDVTGFDRVMLYSFHPDGHGEVVAESVADGVESFLGLHYPATDIPRQARVLYLRNWTRLIVDSAAAPAPLVPDRHPVTGRAINLGLAQLRAVSPIHLQYLRNMGVAGSMSMSVVADGELVGLIACHHGTPRHVPYPVRAGAELVARVLSEQLMRAEAREQAALAKQRRSVQMRVMRWMLDAGGTEHGVDRLLEEMLPVVRADATIAVVGGTTYQIGELPVDRAAIARMVDRQGSATAVDLLDDGPGGVLVVPGRVAGDFTCWWRQPVRRTVTWAGNPHEGVGADGDKLTPRSSFAAWEETTADACEPWTPNDLAVAIMFGTTLGLTRGDDEDLSVLIESLSAHSRELEAANTDLRELAAEREMMLSAVAHDLRGPLRAVSSFTDIVVSGDDLAADTLAAARHHIGTGVEHMSELLDGLQRWSRVGDVVPDGEVDLGRAIQTVLTALQPQLDAAHAVVRIEELPRVLGDASSLRELFQNLVENAIRYREPSRRLEIAIGAERTEGKVVTVFVADNGVGIDAEHLPRIFELFRQVDDDREGVGLGLALVQRIARAHDGGVRVDSVRGEGSVFHVELQRID